MGIDHQPRELLKNVQDLEVIDLPNATECCGFGGLFAIKMGDISSAMLQRKLDAIESTGAQAVVGCDVSCLLNIGGGLHRRGSKIETKYIAEVLLDADKHDDADFANPSFREGHRSTKQSQCLPLRRLLRRYAARNDVALTESTFICVSQRPIFL